MAGRPRREISDEEILAVIDRMHDTDDSVSKICKELKLSTAQYYDALEKNQIFKRLHVHAHTERAEKCVDQIHEALQELKDKKMDPSSARVYIDTKKWEAAKYCPRFFGERQQVEVTGNTEKPVVVRKEIDLEELSRLHYLIHDETNNGKND